MSMRMTSKDPMSKICCLAVAVLLLCAIAGSARSQGSSNVSRITAAYQISRNATADGDLTTIPGLSLQASLSHAVITNSLGIEYKFGDYEDLTVYSDASYSGGLATTGRSYPFISAGLGIGSAWGYRTEASFLTELRGSLGYSVRTGKRMELTPALIYRMSMHSPGDSPIIIRHQYGFQFGVTWAFIQSKTYDLE